MKKFFGVILTGAVTMFLATDAGAGDVTIQAHNKLDYYLDREADTSGVHSDSLRNRLVVDLLYGGFYGGIWYEAFHPIGRSYTNPPDTSFEGITQRYFGWTDGDAEVRIGNFYANFNRGLLLRAYESEDIQVDKNIDGIWGTYRGEKYNFELLSGRILLADNPGGAPLVRNHKNELLGARVGITPIRQVQFGGAAVRYLAKGTDPVFDPGRYTNAWEVVGGMSFGSFDFYGGYAHQKGTRGFYLGRFDLEEGDGTYLTASISTGLIGFAAEYKNYYNMALDFNAPPVANHRNQSSNAFSGGNGTNDRGFQLSMFLAPLDDWTFEANIAQGQERPDPVTGHSSDRLYNNFYEVRGYIGRDNIIASYERTDMGLEGMEHLPYGEVTIYLDDENTVTATGQVIKYEKVISGKPDYNEIDYSLSFTHSYFLTFTVLGGFTSEEFNIYEDPYPSRSGAVSINIRYGQHDLNIYYGDQRGGYVCTEGACRIVPPFRGLKLLMISRF